MKSPATLIQSLAPSSAQSSVGPPSALQSTPFWTAIIVHANGAISRLTEIVEMHTSKTDSGDAGTFSLDLVLTPDAPAAYNCARLIGPRDIVALYAVRQTTGAMRAPYEPPAYGDDYTPGIFPLGPPATVPLSYPTSSDLNATLTKALTTFNCVFIGDVDKAVERKSPDQTDSSLHIEGRDFTSLLIDTETQLAFTVGSPDVVVPQQFWFNYTSFNPRGTPGATFGYYLLRLLDLTVAKGLAAATDPSIAGVFPVGTILAAAQARGYQWRAYIDTTMFDTSYIPFQKTVYPNYSIQAGSAWANAQQLANYPISRLFVNELGQLVFDDAFNAWTQQPIAAVIHSDTVLRAEWTQDDSTVMTDILVIPEMAAAGATLQGAGVLASAQALSSPTAISRFSYRLWVFYTFFDPLNKAANQRRADICSFSVNNLWTCELEVMGQVRYRVGQRIYLDYGGAHPATQRQVWYIAQVDHDFTWGTGWTTTLMLRYPLNPDGSAQPGVGMPDVTTAPLRVYAPVPFTEIILPSATGPKASGQLSELTASVTVGQPVKLP